MSRVKVNVCYLPNRKEPLQHKNLKGTIIIFFYGNFSKVSARKKSNLRVVAVTHGDNPQFLTCCQKKGDNKKLRVVAVIHGDDPHFFSFCQKKGGKNKLRVVALTYS